MGAATGHVAQGALEGTGLDTFTSDVATTSASAITIAATRSAITGTSFARNIERALPDAIGQAIGRAVGGEVSKAITRSRDPAQVADAVKAGTGGLAGLSSRPMLTGDGKLGALGTSADGLGFDYGSAFGNPLDLGLTANLFGVSWDDVTSGVQSAGEWLYDVTIGRASERIDTISEGFNEIIVTGQRIIFDAVQNGIDAAKEPLGRTTLGLVTSLATNPIVGFNVATNASSGQARAIGSGQIYGAGDFVRGSLEGLHATSKLASLNPFDRLEAARGLVASAAALPELPGQVMAEVSRINALEGNAKTEAITRLGTNAVLTAGTALMGGGAARVSNVVRAPKVTGVVERVPEGFTRSYRAVSQAEFDDIVKTGRFSVGPNSVEGKYFADTLEGVHLHGSTLQGVDRYKIIQADLPNNAPSLYTWPNLDGYGPARFLHIDDLTGVKPVPYKGGK